MFADQMRGPLTTAGAPKEVFDALDGFVNSILKWQGVEKGVQPSGLDPNALREATGGIGL